MSQVAENKSNVELEDSFDAIQEIIENLSKEFYSKRLQMVRSAFAPDRHNGTENGLNQSDDSTLSNDAVDVEKERKESETSNIDTEIHEISQLQIEINQRFCQLRSVCKDEDAVKKFDDLFWNFAASELILKERATELWASEIRKNDELSIDWANAMHDFRLLKQEMIASGIMGVTGQGHEAAGQENTMTGPVIAKSNDDVADDFKTFVDDLLQILVTVGAAGADSNISVNAIADGEASSIDGPNVDNGSKNGMQFPEFWTDFKQVVASSKSVLDCVLGDAHGNGVKASDSKSAE